MVGAVQPCRHRHPDLHADDRGHVHRQRHLSPGELEVADHTQMDEATRPLDDLHLHRRQLHPVRSASPARTRRLVAVLDRLGRRTGGCAAEDVLAVSSTLGGGSAVPAPGMGRRLVHRADHERRRPDRGDPADRGRRVLQRGRGALRIEVAQPVAGDIRPP